jgi:hypothetical protein
MNPKSSRQAALAFLSISIGVCAGLVALGPGCAGVSSPGGRNNGAGGSWVMPSIPGLVSLAVTPSSQSLALVQSGTTLTGTVSYHATGHMSDGTSQDVTALVGWPSAFKSLMVQAGVATVTAPGTYTITAASGSVTATAQLVASFNGNVFAPDFSPSGQGALDGNPTVGAVSIAYPLDGAIFPPNLSPIYVHVSKGTQATSNLTTARLTFTADNVNVNYYGNCETADPTSGVADPGPGCYVRLPLSFTQLFIAVSEVHDIQLTARIGGGGALVESNTINVAWANVPLSGGLYYWTTMTANAFPGYTLPSGATTGTGIQRYDFSMDGAAPELVYTDQGTPPNFPGSPSSPSSPDSGGGLGTCIGCHAITNDGTTMALSINGSNGGGLALLDIANKALRVVNPNPTTGGAMDNLRVANFAATTTFSPAGDMMVNMYRSVLHLTPTNAFPLSWQSEVAPSWGEYKGDPFWSQDGKYLVFTSFSVPDVLSPYNDGLNGDMKRGGQIVIASAQGTSVNDDAHALVPRETGVTSYYPVVSNDSKLVAFCRSTCSSDPNQVDLYGSGYGDQTCDGYDDSSATLWLTTPDGGAAPISLDAANGAGSTSDNSWPRWSPDSGLFRGQSLYWLAFSSRRPYGLQVNASGPSASKPQLWFAAVLIGSGGLSSDPSFAPVWLPNQNPNQSMPNGNHVPQWVKVAVVIPG